MGVLKKVKPNAGSGGKLGRSNMDYWGNNKEQKVAARRQRRLADREALDEGLADVAQPDRKIKRRRETGRR